MKESWLWLGGWSIEPAIAEAWLRERAPQAQHQWLYPGPDWATQLADALPRADRLYGYSLGSFLLAQAIHTDSLDAADECVLLAPFCGFSQEQGGVVEASRIRILQRWLKRDPLAVITDFYQRADIRLKVPSLAFMDAHADALQWGLDVLRDDGFTPQPERLQAKTTQCVIGADDRILNVPQWSTLPNTTVKAHAGHCLTALLG